MHKGSPRQRNSVQGAGRLKALFEIEIFFVPGHDAGGNIEFS
jgi:hypothetical protein